MERSGQERKRVHLIVRGRVQGVFFRASVAREALGLGTTGWIRNLPDGTVEAEIEGATSAVDDLVAYCQEGPPNARVDRIEVTDAEPTNEAGSFRVR